MPLLITLEEPKRHLSLNIYGITFNLFFNFNFFAWPNTWFDKTWIINWVKHQSNTFKRLEVPKKLYKPTKQIKHFFFWNRSYLNSLGPGVLCLVIVIIPYTICHWMLPEHKRGEGYGRVRGVSISQEQLHLYKWPLHQSKSGIPSIWPHGKALSLSPLFLPAIYTFQLSLEIDNLIVS